MRVPLLTAGLVTGLLLAGCSSSEPAATSTTPAASASAAASGAASLAATPAPTSSSASAQGSASASASVQASASASASPTPSGRYIDKVIPATITGMHVSGVQDGAWPDRNVPFGTLRLWDAGTNWSQVEAVKGRYNWKPLDTAVKNAQAHGIKDILLVLGSTPSWNATHIKAGDYPVPGAASPPKSLAAWDAFVKAVVTRYQGRITSYQIWNEASLGMFWKGTPQQLADLTKRAYDIIKATDPKARVVAASTTVRLQARFDKFFPAYLQALGDLGWPVDVYSAHMYPAAKDDTDTRAQFIGSVQQALRDAGAPAKPLWDTELNYGLNGPGPSNPKQNIGGAAARDWVVQTELDSLHLGVDRTYWYIWTPTPYPLLGMQLTNDSGAVKGLRVLNQWLVGATWKGCTDDGAAVACYLEKAGVPSIIAWAVQGPVAIPAPAGYTQACGTNNACKPIEGTVELKDTPVRLTQ